MSLLPRFALGSLQPQADPALFSWALLEVLTERGLNVQSFLGQATFPPHDGARVITGRCSRQLDTWLMSAALCRELLSHGAAGHDLAVVTGRFAAPGNVPATAKPASNLETLCTWLDLPRLAVLDVSTLGTGHLPPGIAELDGVFLDGVPNEAAAAYWQTSVESLWGVKVLGYLDTAPAQRAEAASLPPGMPPAAALVRALGRRLAGTLQLEQLLALADRPWNSPRSQLYSWHTCQAPLTIAIAYDLAFHCYFPDVVDLLELAGAHVRDFSPLKDAELPPDADLVYFGCGHVERYAERLAANHCLKQALRRHVARGGRVYGEGGGAAYLCREMVLENGHRYSNCGLVPAVAHLQPLGSDAVPVEAALAQPCWLGSAESLVRGYRNPHWRFTLATEHEAAPAEARDIFATERVVASGLHLNFAALPCSFAQLLTPLCSATLAFSR